MDALAAAAVTFDGPEAASLVTGIPAAEFRAARRTVSAEKAAEIARQMSGSATGNRARRKPGVRSKPSANGLAMATSGTTAAGPNCASPGPAQIVPTAATVACPAIPDVDRADAERSDRYTIDGR
jgi:hypothetical protein